MNQPILDGRAWLTATKANGKFIIAQLWEECPGYYNFSAYSSPQHILDSLQRGLLAEYVLDFLDDVLRRRHGVAITDLDWKETPVDKLPISRRLKA